MLGVFGPCSHEVCLLERHDDHLSFAATASDHSEALSALIHTGSTARSRRNYHHAISPPPQHHQHPAGLTAIRLRSMEEVHGVDVSWTHHPGKEHTRKHAPIPTPPKPIHHKSVGALPTDSALPPRTSSLNPPPSTPPSTNGDIASRAQPTTPIAPTPPAPAQPARDAAHVATAVPTTPPAGNGAAASAKAQQKRPGLMSRNSTDKAAGHDKSGSRRTSWLNNISSKFSSSSQQTTPERPTSAPAQAGKQNGVNPPGTTTSPARTPDILTTHQEEAEERDAYVPTKSKDTGFFSSLTRRLSSASTTSAPKTPGGNGGVCARRVLNVDPNRPRVLIPEMDPSRLRKVSFCVDVEIAGGPRYYDDDDEPAQVDKRKDKKMKERAEGEALKRPQALEEEKEKEGAVKLDAQSTHTMNGSTNKTDEDEADVDERPPKGDIDGLSRKKEKKKKAEEERKERQQQRRLRAQENGSIPVELSMGDDDSIPGTDAPSDSGSQQAPSSAPSTSAPAHPEGPAPHKPAARQDRPTTDPVRIYRRCCQLRETPILKRITEQLMRPNCVVPLEPGVVNCLDLTGSRLQLADMVTLGDWLAVVPIKQLRLENADLNDEGLRCILAGLLAAKRPEPTKRRSGSPQHRNGVPVKSYTERSGIIEKLNLKNNPRITRLGWKHICLFIYMCRSLRAIDISMNQFPKTFPASTHVSPVKSPSFAPAGDGSDTDAAETFYQCLSERPGGSRLEELIISECGFSSAQIKRILDGAMACGISRVGLAGNHIDDDSLQHVLHYIRSGACHALDLGGNDLRGKLGLIAEAMNDRPQLSFWGLSLAGCNLDTADLKILFPALVKLPDMRFLDLSHNQELCRRDNGTISLFRRYMGQFKELKRVHLADVNMSPRQAIALADCLPDGPKLAHLNILENPMLSALAHAQDESTQEEACALYASLMAAVRVSSTLICIDIDVPSQENSEVVKALAKQVVAYSIRNMEQFAIAEATGVPTANATAQLTEPHGGERKVKEITVPDVLMHLVGHVDGVSENHDNDPPAPDEDYIVGGAGVVKALQYVLGEKAADLRRTSVPGTPVSGGMTPREGRPGSSAGLEFTEEQRGKAKKMSKNLLDSARKVRTRLQPALAKEAAAGDEMAYRRLNFLDQTLQSIIQRFEEEYPECRVHPPPGSPEAAASIASSLAESDRKTDLSLNTQATEYTTAGGSDDENDESEIRPPRIRRTASQVSLASRALGIEEGNLHRLGQRMRREVLDSPTTSSFTIPTLSSLPTFVPAHDSRTTEEDQARLHKLQEKIESTPGPELKTLVESVGWSEALGKIGGNFEDLRRLQEADPEGWAQFVESQMKARLNMETR